MPKPKAKPAVSQKSLASPEELLRRFMQANPKVSRKRAKEALAIIRLCKCGVDLKNRAAWAVFCSDACRHRDWQTRNRERRNAYQFNWRNGIKDLDKAFDENIEWLRARDASDVFG